MKLEVLNLTKSFGNKEVLKNINFTFESGKIYGLLGRNGAGKTTFFNCLNDVFSDNKKIRIENSTTAITYVDIENNFSIDFVIIKLFPFNKEIIRRNNKENSSVNEFTWNPLRKFNQAYEKMKSLTSFQKQDLIQNYILPKKVIEKQKKDSDLSRKSSCEIFIEEVNNYVVKKQNH